MQHMDLSVNPNGRTSTQELQREIVGEIRFLGLDSCGGRVIMRRGSQQQPPALLTLRGVSEDGIFAVAEIGVEYVSGFAMGVGEC